MKNIEHKMFLGEGEKKIREGGNYMSSATGTQQGGFF